jgi:hypothetical protein
MSEVEREEAAAATIETAAAVMETTAAITAKVAATLKTAATVVMTMTVADDRDGSGGNDNDGGRGNGIDRGGSGINGKLAAVTERAVVVYRRGHWLVSNISDVRIMWNITAYCGAAQ